jgi:predicted nucleic acid-binding protein
MAGCFGMIHFDANFLIQTVVAGSLAHEKFRGWTQGQEDCNASRIAWAEFLCGPLDAPAEAIARQIFQHPEPFLPADAILAARLFNQTGRRSRSLADCMIAAVAVRCGAKLATNNTADFQPFLPHGLVLA